MDTHSRPQTSAGRVAHAILAGNRALVEDATRLDAGRGYDGLSVIHCADNRGVLLDYTLYAMQQARDEETSPVEIDPTLIAEASSDLTKFDQYLYGILTGEHDLVDDAITVHSPDGLQALEVHHSVDTTSCRRLILRYNFETAYRLNPPAMEEFDIYDVNRDD